MPKKFSWLNFFFGSPQKQVFFGCVFLILSLLANLAFERLFESVDAHGKMHHEVPFWVHVVEELLRDIGIAFFVAAAIHYSVESFASAERQSIFDAFKEDADRRLEEIQDNTLSSFFKQDLPDGWFEFIRGQIDSHKVIRTSMNVDVEIRKVPEEIEQVIKAEALPSFLLYTTTLSYKVKNISKATDWYPIRKFTEFPISDALRRFTKVSEVRVNDVSLDVCNLDNADHNWSDTNNHKMAEHTVEIKPGEVVEILVKSETLKLENDSMVWVSAQPSLGISFRVKVPEEFVLIFAYLHPSAKGNLNKVSENGEAIHVSVEEPVLPFTAAEIRWYRRDVVGDAFIERK